MTSWLFALVGVLALERSLGAPWWALVVLAATQALLLAVAALVRQVNELAEQKRQPINLHVQIGDEPERFIPIWRAEEGDEEE